VLLVIALVGTTVAPWQLFFQQSNIVDKRITPRWINYERADTVVGSLITVFAAAVLMSVVASAFAGTRYYGHFINAGGVATGLQHVVGRTAGTIFAIILLNASIIGAASVTLSTSYAFGDVFGAHHSLHRGWRDAKFFYGAFTAMVVLAAGIVLVASAGTLGLITTGVQALAGVLLPSATVFLLLLCNDRQVLGPWVNRLWLNILASVIVSILLAMSLVLMITTLFKSVDVTALVEVLGGVLLVSYLVAAVMLVVNRSRREPVPVVPMERKATWRMPQLSLLERPTWSRTRLIGMWGLRVYLVVAVLLLLVKAIELGLHHGH
jgi:Mn2+/Fe2+ NRAMP family transporter